MPWRPASPCPRCHRIGGCACPKRAPDTRPSAARRGYGRAHQAERRRWETAVAEGLVDCARCGRPILPGEAWDLGHADDRASWTGPEHARCNRAAPRRVAKNALFAIPVDRGARFVCVHPGFANLGDWP
jgi:hypothetical protein